MSSPPLWGRRHPVPDKRPRWWPEGEPWPPRRPYGWVGRRRARFMWRVTTFLAALVLFVTVLASVGIWLVATALGVIKVPVLTRLVSVAVLGLFAIGIIAAIRGVRRVAIHVGDVVEAAGRIEAGDYTFRIAERGPREVRSLARAFNAMSARLEATDVRRRSFLTDVTHELRTPLAVIRGQAEAIGDGLYPGDSAHVAPILDATRTLELLFEDLGTLTLSEVGSLVLAREPVELAVLVNGSLAAFQSNADAAGVTLVEEVTEDIPLVDADAARLRGVLRNLLSNAIRHTPAGGSIVVAARRSGDHVIVTVRDTGEGIPAELLPRIFDRFAKGPGSRGSGLGLAIARDVVTAHGGRIEAESKVGSGTAVRFSLPIAKDTH